VDKVPDSAAVVHIQTRDYRPFKKITFRIILMKVLLLKATTFNQHNEASKSRESY